MPFNLVILLGLGGFLLYFCGTLRWRSSTARLQARLRAAGAASPLKVYAVGELAGLPAPVQRYFRAALVDGLPIVAEVAVRQTGTFNQSEKAPAWKPFTAAQLVVTSRPGYVWDARIRMFPGVAMCVHDAYAAGEGILQAAIIGLFPVASLRDRGELAEGELMRFLAEAAWYPTSLLPGQGVLWEAVDEHSARATLRDGAIAVTLLFRFNADDLIDTVRAEARGRMEGAEVVRMPWECRLWNYATREGMRVPMEGEVAWIHPIGPKPYWRGRVAKLEYGFELAARPESERPAG